MPTNRSDTPAFSMSRRQMLQTLGFGAASLAVASGGSALAQQSATARAGGAYYRTQVGDIRVTVLSDGQAEFDIIPNLASDPARAAEFEKTLNENFQNKKDRVDFNAVLIETGGRRILIDTGNGAPGGKLLQSLRSVGLGANAIDAVFITHFHGDHMNGLTDEKGQLVFPRAKLITGEAEYQFWSNPDLIKQLSANEATKGLIDAQQKNILAFKDRWTLVKDGGEIAPGLSAVLLPGHTPGHMGVRVSSGDDRLVLIADAAHHSILHLELPNVSTAFDTDPQACVATRVKLLEQLSAERTRMMAYHFPWPGTGFIKRKGGAFEFIPEIYRI
jgi:glyoxylase-like metal-dependent hydrolase (beta-lactamase superfamily II)